jgi:hypothetical protein
MLDKIDLGNARPEPGSLSQPKITIRSVEISVRPEVTLKLQGKTGQLMGAIKLHFPRTFLITDDAAGYLSAVLKV